MHGKGVIDAPDGKRYAGQFAEGARSGFGVTVNQKTSHLKSYKGFYSNDLPNGLGEAEYADGGVYKGYWVDGQRSGHGIMFYADQTNYMGRY